MCRVNSVLVWLCYVKVMLYKLAPKPKKLTVDRACRKDRMSWCPTGLGLTRLHAVTWRYHATGRAGGLCACLSVCLSVRVLRAGWGRAAHNGGYSDCRFHWNFRYFQTIYTCMWLKCFAWCVKNDSEVVTCNILTEKLYQVHNNYALYSFFLI